ncbi:unnamed protein product [Kuraishia capsulata CBS 1993]|uniref:SAM domain-containing protein n=1 Tax=Kuraishia capsulata CBS 1993 TaxID=1382522 RepID=W6MNM8_9ASCO|nr:uncharacterized protein KUCA_T00003863001 [Kuraishia capsulata CBS 1993]CDK27883.1 unnamed protein product [Kuraishia capsulata CBS 1993]
MTQPASTATLSPTPSAASMAVLSPPSSRYAFEPRDDNVTSPLLTGSTFSAGNGNGHPMTPTSGTLNSSTEFYHNGNSHWSQPSSNSNASFNSDLNSYNNWIKGLNTNEQVLAVDLLLNSVSEEAIQYARSKLNGSTLLSPSIAAPVASPTIKIHQPQVRAASPILALNHEPLTLDNVLNDLGIMSSINNDVGKAWSSSFDSMRPRSAGPLDFTESYSLNAPVQQPNRVFSPDMPPSRVAPVSQVAPAQLLQQQQQQQQSQFGSYGMQFDTVGQQNAYKLNALSTIAMRSKLDSKREERGRTAAVRNAYPASTSSSLPPAARVTPSSPPARNAGPAHVAPVTPKAKPLDISSPKKVSLPKDIADPQLLNNIPAWLKALRLHKYTDNLKHLTWKEMINLDESGLEALGVGTVGARGKLMKAFSTVKGDAQ